MRKNLFNVGALLRGFSTTFSYMFKKMPTIQYPSVKKQHAPRFHGLHELRRYEDGKERCIGCELCSSVCPANALPVCGACLEGLPRQRHHCDRSRELTDGPSFAGGALCGTLRNRRAALHLLWNV